MELALYGSTMHIATIPSFAVLHTEKLAIQCATLLGIVWARGDKAMNVAVLCGVFWTIFFLLSMLVP